MFRLMISGKILVIKSKGGAMLRRELFLKDFDVAPTGVWLEESVAAKL